MFGFGGNLNLTSDELADIWRQVIAVYNDNDPAPEKIPYEVSNLVNDYNRKPERIFPPRL